jgi:hypothetical protein
MNCKKITQLIPLFVEADLEVFEMEQLSAHFAVCNLCSDAMKEFQASQFMLHNFAAPEFNEEVFAQMRSSVLNEIARPQIENLSSTFWNWKVAFAASLAMVILVSGIAMNLHNRNENYVAQSDNFNDQKSENFIAAPSPKLKIAAINPSSLHRIPKPRSGRNSIAQGEASISKRNPGNVIENHPSPERAIEIDREENSVAINNSIAVIHETTAVLDEEKLTTEPEMLRIELQTADPNIRIIWFAPKERIVVNTKADMH